MSAAGRILLPLSYLELGLGALTAPLGIFCSRVEHYLGASQNVYAMNPEAFRMHVVIDTQSMRDALLMFVVVFFREDDDLLLLPSSEIEEHPRSAHL